MKLLKNLSSRTFRSLKVRNYRIYFFAQFISISGMWMQLVAQGWLVLKLTDSGLALGVTAALQFLPLLVLGAWGGLLADRFDKRKGLVLTQTAAGILALILGLLTATGAVELWMVYALSLLLGFVNVIDMPMRQAFVVEMVGARDLPNAVALNGASFTAARMVGPAAAGILIQVAGIAPSFFINAVTYLAVIGGLLAMRRSELMSSAPLVRARGQLREGFRYVWKTHDLRFTLLMIALVATFAFNFQVLLPVLAKHEFGGDAGTYGLMGSVMGFGAVVGALFAAAQHRPRRKMLLGASLGSGIFLIATAAAPTLPIALICLWFVGASNLVFIATANATLQVTCDDKMRGRVMALYAIVFLGGTPVGGPIIGWIAEQFGGRAGVLAGGVVALLAAGLGTGVRLRARRRPRELRLEPEANPELAVLDREREIAGR